MPYPRCCPERVKVRSLPTLAARATRSQALETVEEYRRHAADCDELARNAPNETQREQIKKIAETWRKLADERERWVRSQQHVQNKA